MNDSSQNYFLESSLTCSFWASVPYFLLFSFIVSRDSEAVILGKCTISERVSDEIRPTI